MVPNILQCPEYELNSFFSLQEQLVSDNTTHKQAAALLCTIWIANNETHKVLWHEQLQADAHKAHGACPIYLEEEAEKWKEK
jgi:hypothetical protein